MGKEGVLRVRNALAETISLQVIVDSFVNVGIRDSVKAYGYSIDTILDN